MLRDIKSGQTEKDKNNNNKEQRNTQGLGKRDQTCGYQQRKGGLSLQYYQDYTVASYTIPILYQDLCKPSLFQIFKCLSLFFSLVILFLLNYQGTFMIVSFYSLEYKLN